MLLSELQATDKGSRLHIVISVNPKAKRRFCLDLFPSVSINFAALGPIRDALTLPARARRQKVVIKHGDTQQRARRHRCKPRSDLIIKAPFLKAAAAPARGTTTQRCTGLLSPPHQRAPPRQTAGRVAWRPRPAPSRTKTLRNAPPPLCDTLASARHGPSS
mmetsp:Transcript_5222/g.10109  ORF Transcript_5222/g.10109 Transcript_5222/m.10109 type:complete len:161 (+) Transcript_5222:556-1038(+)